MRTGERTLRFHALLGRGGFGTVYLATLHGASGFRRRVAVKLLHAGLDGHADLQARQRDEARLLGLLHHPAVVSVLELASVGRRPAVVMEYVEAVDVATLQAALPMGRVPLRALAELVAAVADALDSAWHARDPDDGRALRVVHRDIKPSNVLLTPDGQVKVLDFGIARFDADTREGHTSRIVLGTPRYMAPESWSGEAPAHALDIYALGATAWELWSGRPWERSADREQHEARIAAAAAFHTGLPPTVDDLLRAMAAWEPSRRPSARQVHATLRAWCTHAGPRGGDSLATIAARHVPALRAARAEALAGEELPSPAALTGGTSVERAPSARAVAIRRVAALGWVALVLVLLGWMRLRVPGSATATVHTEAPPDLASAPAGGPMRRDEPSRATAPSLAVVPAAPRTARPRASPPRDVSLPDAAPPQAPSTLATPTPMDARTLDMATGDTPAAAPFRIVTVPPEAVAWLDGRRLGTTPVVVDALPAGSHRVEVELDGARARTDVVTGEDGARGVRYDYAPGSWRTLR